MFFLCIFISILLLVIIFTPNSDLVWRGRNIFIKINYIQWILGFPLRKIFNNINNSSNKNRYLFMFLWPLWMMYFLLFYIITTPIRFINAIYFDIFLFLSSIRNEKSLFIFLGFIFQSIIILCIDLVYPTLTMFHGTNSWSVNSILKTNTWSAGMGNYIGTGIYFAIDYKTALHYSKPNKLVIVVRITNSFWRPVSTFSRQITQQIGLGFKNQMHRSIDFPWRMLEHWRNDYSWYEYCILVSHSGSKESIWRIRPICVIENDEPQYYKRKSILFHYNSKIFGIVIISILIVCVILGRIFIDNNICSNVLISRIHVGDMIITRSHSQPFVKIYPNSSKLLEAESKNVANGTILRVLSGPRCAGESIWWKVSYSRNLSGWIPEILDSSYIVSPYQ